MILCDAGPLVALNDQGDPHHARCVAALASLGDEDMVTTPPCLTEAMHLVARRGGHPAQERLWELTADGTVEIDAGAEAAYYARMRVLMRRYKDSPMDLADASLVVLAERLDLRRIFTLDKHFRAYLIHDKFPFDIIS